jgi:hypothetical protein
MNGLPAGPRKLADNPGDLFPFALEGEMSGIDEMHLAVRIIALKGFDAGRQEERIVLALDREKRGPSDADEFLETWIKHDIAGVIQEQIQLDLVVAEPRDQCRVEHVGLRHDQRLVRDAMDVLEFGRLGLEEVSQRRAIGAGRLPPIFLDRVPAFAQTFNVGVTVLRDERGIRSGCARARRKLAYSFHDRDILVAACGRICLHRKKINVSTVLAGQRLGIKEVDGGIWLVSFMTYDLGYFDGAKNLATPRQPLRPEVVTYVLGTLRYLCVRTGQHKSVGSGRGIRTPDTRI